MSEAPDEATQEQEGDQPDEQPPPIQPPDDDEAQEAEESEEVEGQQGDQDEPEQPEARAQSPKELEQLFGKLERETERHTKRVHEIVGASAADLLACPLCDDLIPGFIMPTPDTPQRFPSVREFMGDAQPAAYQQDPNTRTCQTCDGMGEVETGSKVQGQITLVCTDCGGKGWQGQRPTVATSGPMAPAPPPDANGHTENVAPTIDPPDVADLKRKGYTIIPPVGVS